MFIKHIHKIPARSKEPAELSVFGLIHIGIYRVNIKFGYIPATFLYLLSVTIFPMIYLSEADPLLLPGRTTEFNVYIIFAGSSTISHICKM